MSKDLKDLNLKSIKLMPLVAKYSKKYSRHTPFILLLVVLLTYVYVVARISALSKAEPPANQAPDTSTLIPRVNQKAIDQIQSLETNNTQIHSLFEQARNNPFSE
jgi:hypothetical protein